MRARRVIVVLLAAYFVISTTSPFSETPRAQSADCSQELNRQEAALKALDRDVSKDTNELIRTDVANTALKGLRANLKGDPHADAVEEAKAKYEEWKEWVEQTKLTKEILDEVSECLKLNKTGCMAQIMANVQKSAELLRESSDAWAAATKKWIDSLESDSVSDAAERVDNARNVLERAATRSNGLYNDAVNQGLASCMRNYEQRAQAQRDPVDLRTAQPSVPPSTPDPKNGGNGANGAGGGDGIGAGTIVGYSAAAVGAAVGVKMANDYTEKQAQKAQCNQYETEMDTRTNSVVNAANALIACGSSLSCVNSRETSLNNALSAMLTTAGAWCSCLGPDAATELSAEDKAQVRDAFNSLRSAGVSPGSLPACFR